MDGTRKPYCSQLTSKGLEGLLRALCRPPRPRPSCVLTCSFLVCFQEAEHWFFYFLDESAQLLRKLPMAGTAWGSALPVLVTGGRGRQTRLSWHTRKCWKATVIKLGEETGSISGKHVTHIGRSEGRAEMGSSGKYRHLRRKAFPSLRRDQTSTGRAAE